MDTLMPDNHYYDLLNSTLKRIEDKVDRTESKVDNNTALTQQVHLQAQKTNGKVIKLREDVDALQSKGKIVDPTKLPDFWSDPIIRKTIFIMAVVILTLVAGATGINLIEKLI